VHPEWAEWIINPIRSDKKIPCLQGIFWFMVYSLWYMVYGKWKSTINHTPYTIYH